MKIIILYDSNDGIPEQLQDMLQGEGYEVTIADSVKHFKRLVKECYDAKAQVLILADINLSDWGEGEDGGILAIQALKDDGVNVPTVFFTKYPNNEENKFYQRAKQLSHFFIGEKEARDLPKICEVIEHAIFHVQTPNQLTEQGLTQNQLTQQGLNMILYSGGQGAPNYLIGLEDICYWQANGVMSSLYTLSGQHIYRALTILNIWTQLKDFSPFLKRLGVGPIVNLKNVTHYHENYLYFKGNNIPPLQIPHAQYMVFKEGLLNL